MGITGSVRFGAITAALLIAGAADAASDPFRIRHAEPVVVESAELRAAAAAPESDSARTLSFLAYGRQFDLELEPNTRLLNALSASQRREFAQYEVLRGRLSGMPGSWVRIVRSGIVLRGAIWDGSDLYSIGPAQDLSGFLEQPVQIAPGVLSVYRLSDVSGPAMGAACGLRMPAGAKTDHIDYSKLIAELQSAAATLPDRQLDIAFIADGEFAGANRSDPQAAALARINIVDGIYSEQVGVIIVAPVIRVFGSVSQDPFTTSSAEDLLTQLSNYRVGTQDVRDRGLAHLFTGRDLNDNIAGIANLGGLCSAKDGVGLAESWHPELISALISAHEVGHNFSAPHDGEDGSPCVNISQSFLMSPFVNASSTFSRCSVNQMFFGMENAACILPADVPDARMQGGAGLIAAAPGQTFSVPFEVASIGTADLSSANVSVSVPANLSFVSASLAGGSCGSFFNGVVTCSLGALAAGTFRTGSVQMTAPAVGTWEVPLRVTAPGDRRPENDLDFVRVDVGDGADLSVGVSPSRVEMLTGQSFTLVVTVASVGTLAVDGASVLIQSGGLIVDELQAPPGTTCTGTSGFSCTLGTVPAGEIRQIALRARGALPLDETRSVLVHGTNDVNFGNNRRDFRLLIAAAADAMVEANIRPSDQPFDESLDIPFTVASIGPLPVEDVVAQIAVPAGFVVDSATAGGTTCTVNGTDVRCVLGTLASKTSRLIVVRGRGTEEGSNFVATLSAANDANPSNNVATASIRIRPGLDVELSSFSANPHTGIAFEGRPFQLSASFSNRGVKTLNDVIINMTLPEGADVLDVSGTPTCEVTGRNVGCTIPSLPTHTGGSVQVRLVMHELGSYSASASVSAPGDQVSANNSRSTQFTIEPDVDVGISVPQQLFAGVRGTPVEIPVIVRTGLRPIDDVRLTFSVGLPFVLENVTPDLMCPIVAGFFECALGDLGAQSEFVVTVRLRFDEITERTIFLEVRAAGDTEFGNNIDTVQVDFAEPSDVELQIANPTVAATAGIAFTTEISAQALGAITGRNVHLFSTLPPDLVLHSVGGAICTAVSTASSSDCFLFTVEPGFTRTVRYTFLATKVGTYTVQYALAVSNDPNLANNSGQLTINVNAAPPPPPQPAPVNDGGGGGGALGWLPMALLGWLQAMSALRRRRSLTLLELQ